MFWALFVFLISLKPNFKVLELTSTSFEAKDGGITAKDGKHCLFGPQHPKSLKQVAMLAEVFWE